MATSYKALALMEAVAAELALRLPALAQTRSDDGTADKNPTLQLGAGTAGAAGGFILIKPMDWTAKDVLGNAANRFSPHVIQVVLEANNAAGAGADVNTLATISTLVTVLARKGARLEIYQETAGAAAGLADIVPAKLVTALDADLYLGMVGNV